MAEPHEAVERAGHLEADAAGHAPCPRHLCICADDFGLSSGVNAAIFDLAESQKISATSCLVRRSAWGQGAQNLRHVDPGSVDVGLHLDLTRPATVDGAEPNLLGLIARAYTRTIRTPQLRAEISSQLSRFEDAMDRMPAFVDGHRHVHQLPVVRELLVEELTRRYRAPLPWLRSTAPRQRRGAGRLKAGIIHALGGAASAGLAARRSIPLSRGLLGVYDFDGDEADYRSRFQDWIAAAATGDVLMCHPSAGLLPSDTHGAARLHEYSVLRTITFPLETRLGVVFLAPLSRLLRNGAPGWTRDPAGHPR